MKQFMLLIVIYAMLRGILAIAGFYSIGAINSGILGGAAGLIAQWLAKPATN
jgi:hypothetical protein